MGTLGSEKFQLPVIHYCSLGFRVTDIGNMALVILGLTGEKSSQLRSQLLTEHDLYDTIN